VFGKSDFRVIEFENFVRGLSVLEGQRQVLLKELPADGDRIRPGKEVVLISQESADRDG
jgi:hypothetical protein